MTPFDIIVIGGGPAGMMAAGVAARRGASVLLTDKNPRCGRKLALTGKGRCNITNDCDTEAFLRQIPGNGRFLYSALKQFSPQDTMAFFESLGVPVKVERGKRVFPVSDQAMDIVGAMRRFITHENITFRQGEVLHLLAHEGVCTGAAFASGTVLAKAVILATGGLSYPKTGSTGDGYRFAKAFGHTVVPPKASLVGLSSGDGVCPVCAGLTLKNAGVCLLENEKPVFRDFGEVLFTHTGISGPAILRASAHMRRNAAYAVEINLKPALTGEMLDARLLRELADGKRQAMKTIASRLLPQVLVAPLLARAGIPQDVTGAEVTKPQRQAFAAVLQRFRIDHLALGPIDEAVITAGGVDLSQINPKTMASKLISGLFFAGEVLDLDGYTGGFNLQIAFSTGNAAGIAAAGTAAVYTTHPTNEP